MDTETLANSQFNTTNKEGKRRKKTYVFFICLLVSSFIWCLVKFSKDYTAVLKYPIVFVNIPSNHILVSNVDSALVLTVRAQGLTLLRHQLFKTSKRLTIDLSKRNYTKYGKKYNSYVLTSTIAQQLSNQLNFQNSVIDIYPDTLFYKFDNITKKKVPVRVLLNINFAKQYQLYNTIRCFPDSVLLSSSHTVIDTIHYVTTEKKYFENLTENQSFYASIYINKSAKYSVTPQQVKINFDVEKYTDGMLDIPVTCDSKGVRIKLFPEKIRITYLVALKDYKKVTSDLFLAKVHLLNTNESNENKLKVEIIKAPLFVKITRIDPDKVEYIITK